MQTISLYCATCKKHTRHVDLPMEYATACTDCGAHTSELIRAQAEAAASIQSPDGYKADIVENTPTSVTFHIGEGKHKGYYHYDKQTGKKTIRQ